jgi:tight adherence protein C
LNDDRALLAVLLAGAAVLLLAAATALLIRELALRNLEQRVLSLTRGPAARSPANPLDWLGALVSWIGRTVLARTNLYSKRDVAALETMIVGSGFDAGRVLPILLGTKALLAIGFPIVVLGYARLAGFSGLHQFAALCAALPVGLIGPDWLIAMLRRRYLAALRRGMSDALDLLAICTEAGMGMENALEHVSAEIRHSNLPMAVALTKLLDEMRVLPERTDAFRNFAERSGMDGARRVATMLGQALQYGIPISQALRSVATDLRRERMVALEAKAARLPVLLVVPLILFIMPSLFIVLTGPAVLQLLDSLHTAIGR